MSFPSSFPTAGTNDTAGVVFSGQPQKFGAPPAPDFTAPTSDAADTPAEDAAPVKAEKVTRKRNTRAKANTSPDPTAEAVTKYIRETILTKNPVEAWTDLEDSVEDFKSLVNSLEEARDKVGAGISSTLGDGEYGSIRVKNGKVEVI